MPTLPYPEYYWLRPLPLCGERVWRPFEGGRELVRLHGTVPARDGNLSEEWMLSTIRASLHASKDPDAGLCRLREGGAFLRDLIASEPQRMLGRAHAARYGSETGLLVKLLDSRNRLAMQVHPDREAAHRYFHSQFGKTECWHILSLRGDTPEPPCLWLGFREGVTREVWRDCFLRQDIEKMFACLHRFQPKPGETWLVPGGVPHAIGGGCLVAEVQEATDITLRTEKVLPSGVVLTEEDCHLGIGVDAMLDCFHYQGLSEAAARQAYCITPRLLPAAGDSAVIRELVGPDATDCFAMYSLEIPVSATIAPTDVYSGLCLIAGKAELVWDQGSALLRQGDHAFIPAASVGFRIVNQGDVPAQALRFFGPTVQ